MTYLVKKTIRIGTAVYFAGKVLDDRNFDIPKLTRAGVEFIEYPSEDQRSQGETSRTNKKRGALGPDVVEKVGEEMDKLKTYAEVTEDIDAVEVGGVGAPAKRIRIGVGGDVKIEFADGSTAVVTYNSGDVDAINIHKLIADGTEAHDITIYWG